LTSNIWRQNIGVKKVTRQIFGVKLLTRQIFDVKKMTRQIFGVKKMAVGEGGPPSLAHPPGHGLRITRNFLILGIIYVATLK
jgi:hypothetical protein